MTELTPFELMQLYDGELDPRSESDPQAGLDLDLDDLAPAQRAQLGGLLQLSEVLDDVHEFQLPEEGLEFDVAAAVVSRIHAGAAPRLQLVEGGQAAPPTAETPARRVLESRNLEGHAGAAGGVASPEPDRRPLMLLGLLAAAAAAVLVVSSTGQDDNATAVAAAPDSPSTVSASAVPASAPSPDSPEIAVAEEEEPGPLVAIVAVDFGAGSGSIFVVGEASTPVVWMNDDAVEPTRGKVGPL